MASRRVNKPTSRTLRVLTGGLGGGSQPTPVSMSSAVLTEGSTRSTDTVVQTDQRTEVNSSEPENQTTTVEVANTTKSIFTAEAHIKDDAENRVSKINTASINFKDTLKSRKDYEKFVDNLTFALQQLGCAWVLDTHPSDNTTLEILR